MNEDTSHLDDSPKPRIKRRSVSESELSEFIRQYGRRTPRIGEPNDRGYSRNVEKKVKRMSPEEFDRILNGIDDDGEQLPRG